MSQTIDANILIHASNGASPHKADAQDFLRRTVTGRELTVLFWPVLLAYVRISTHASVLDPPLPFDKACGNVSALASAPPVMVMGEGPRFWDLFVSGTMAAQARGNQVTDAHIVALMREHGVTTIWTQDRDFRKFDGIEVRDPFAA